MKRLKKNWFILCYYNTYLALICYNYVAVYSIFDFSKENIDYAFPFVILGVLCWGYIFEYYRKEEKKKSYGYLTIYFIYFLKIYIVFSHIIAPFWIFDNLILKLLLFIIGLGSLFYLQVYFRTEKDILN